MAQSKLSTALLAVLFLSFACSRDESVEVHTAESYRSFTTDGAWCWFSDPRAVFYQGQHRRTYSGWVDSTGSIVVGSYDHGSGDIQPHIIHEKLERDDHDNPSIFITNNGVINVFYSRHSRESSPIFVTRARKPEDISDWEPTRPLRLNDTIAYAGFSDTYTYTNIIQLSGEKDRLYLFWRGADFKPNFSVSDDQGLTWEKGKILVLPERIYRDRRPCMKVASNNRNAIHFAFTDGHPNAEPTNSIYYMKYDNGALFKANGQKIMEWQDLPIDPAQADMVYDAKISREKAWIWDVAETNDGEPVVVYARFPSDSSHVYYYSIFADGKWNNYQLVNSGGWLPHTPEGAIERERNYSGGIVLDHRNPSTVYLSREKNGRFEIERWSTRDKGKTWNATEITANSTYDNVRPFVVRNYEGDTATLLWMNTQKYWHYTQYRSAIKVR